MQKSRDAFRTISEVSEWLDTPAHVLRFWESKFSQLKPVKRAGGRRYYRPDDMELLSGIKRLLHEDGMTIKGVQKLLREKGVKHVAALGLSWQETVGEAIDMTTHVPPEPDHTLVADVDIAPAAAAPNDDADDAPLIEDALIEDTLIESEPPQAGALPQAPRPPRPKDQDRHTAALGDLFATAPTATGVVVSLDAARAQKHTETVPAPAARTTHAPDFQTVRLLTALDGATADRLRKRGKQMSGLIGQLQALLTRLQQD